MRTGDLAQTRVPLRVLLAAARRDLRLTITCLVDRTELSFWDRIQLYALDNCVTLSTGSRDIGGWGALP